MADKLLLVLITDCLSDPEQPRKIFDPDELKGLAETLKARGMLQPLRLRLNPDGSPPYLIVCGERRWRAAPLAGLTEVPALLSDQPVSRLDLLLEQFTENDQRANLRYSERAHGYRVLIEEEGQKAASLARLLGRSKASISKALALLKLPADLLKAVDDGRLPTECAYEISRCPDEKEQRRLARKLMAKEITQKELLQQKPALQANQSRSRLEDAPPAPHPCRMAWTVDGYEVALSGPKTLTNSQAAKVLERLLGVLCEAGLPEGNLLQFRGPDLPPEAPAEAA
jgi:ParB family transcriptional regulator, chromosome partitioning protein